MPYVKLDILRDLARALGTTEQVTREALSRVNDPLARADRIETLGPDACPIGTIPRDPLPTELPQGPERNVGALYRGQWRGVPSTSDGATVEIDGRRYYRPDDPRSRHAIQADQDAKRDAARDLTRAKRSKPRRKTRARGRWGPGGKSYHS